MTQELATQSVALYPASQHPSAGNVGEMQNLGSCPGLTESDPAS